MSLPDLRVIVIVWGIDGWSDCGLCRTPWAITFEKKRRSSGEDDEEGERGRVGAI